MENAIKAVSNGESVAKAARDFKVPRKTLDDRVKGRVQHGTTPGPDTVLTPEEERGLKEYLLYMAERGFPLSKKMALVFAWAIAIRSGKDSRFSKETGPGNHWWRNFRARHPELSLRAADNLERSRTCALNKEVVNEYFSCLKKILEENELMNKPRQLFNCDETYLPLNFACERVIARKNSKHVYAQARGTSEHNYYVAVWCVSCRCCSSTHDYIF